MGLGWVEMMRAQGVKLPSVPATPTRPDVAAIDHDRILAAADQALGQQPETVTSLPCARSPGTKHDYYSEVESAAAGDAAAKEATTPFTAQRDALFALGQQASALAAAYLLTGEERYAGHAVLHLRAWFVDAETRMTPRLDYGAVEMGGASGAASSASAKKAGGTFAGILETLPLVEIAQAIPFLAVSEALTDADRSELQGWFAAYLKWLTDPQDSGPRLAALARDRKDHHGSSWLLQVSAYTLLTAPETGAPKDEDRSMTELRQRFKRVTLRAQISPDGRFLHELGSETPYRDSLFNLDMIAAICQLLSTRFDSVWDYQLEDGPGMRGAIAYHFPLIEDRAKWPYRADNVHFQELPGRRVSLLLAARAYQRPEYAALWVKLRPDQGSLDVQRTIPVQQPLLWVRQPRRG
jgi:hypothetical protein